MENVKEKRRRRELRKHVCVCLLVYERVAHTIIFTQLHSSADMCALDLFKIQFNIARAHFQLFSCPATNRAKRWAHAYTRMSLNLILKLFYNGILFGCLTIHTYSRSNAELKRKHRTRNACTSITITSLCEWSARVASTDPSACFAFFFRRFRFTFVKRFNWPHHSPAQHKPLKANIQRHSLHWRARARAHTLTNPAVAQSKWGQKNASRLDSIALLLRVRLLHTAVNDFVISFQSGSPCSATDLRHEKRKNERDRGGDGRRK